MDAILNSAHLKIVIVICDSPFSKMRTNICATPVIVVLFHVGVVLFHVGVVLFHVGVVLFHVGVVQESHSSSLPRLRVVASRGQEMRHPASDGLRHRRSVQLGVVPGHRDHLEAALLRHRGACCDRWQMDPGGTGNTSCLWRQTYCFQGCLRSRALASNSYIENTEFIRTFKMDLMDL